MRVKHKANVAISQDSAGKNRLFGLDDTLAEVALDGFTEANSGQVALLANAPFVVPFGGVDSVRGLFLKVTGDFALVLNGGTAVSIKRGSTGGSGAVAADARVLMEANVSTIQVTPVAAATVTYCVWGDPTP